MSKRTSRTLSKTQERYLQRLLSVLGLHLLPAPPMLKDHFLEGCCVCKAGGKKKKKDTKFL